MSSTHINGIMSSDTHSQSWLKGANNNIGVFSRGGSVTTSGPSNQFFLWKIGKTWRNWLSPHKLEKTWETGKNLWAYIITLDDYASIEVRAPNRGLDVVSLFLSLVYVLFENKYGAFIFRFIFFSIFTVYNKQISIINMITFIVSGSSLFHYSNVKLLQINIMTWIFEWFEMLKLVKLIFSYDFSQIRPGCSYKIFHEFKNTAVHFWDKTKFFPF